MLVHDPIFSQQVILQHQWRMVSSCSQARFRAAQEAWEMLSSLHLSRCLHDTTSWIALDIRTFKSRSKVYRLLYRLTNQNSFLQAKPCEGSTTVERFQGPKRTWKKSNHARYMHIYICIYTYTYIYIYVICILVLTCVGKCLGMFDKEMMEGVGTPKWDVCGCRCVLCVWMTESCSTAYLCAARCWACASECPRLWNFLMEPSKRAFAPSNRFFLSSFDSKYIVYHQSTYDILWLDLYTCRIVDLSFLSAGLRQMWVATVANFKSLHGFTKFTTQSQAREAERVGSPKLSACREM